MDVCRKHAVTALRMLAVLFGCLRSVVRNVPDADALLEGYLVDVCRKHAVTALHMLAVLFGCLRSVVRNVPDADALLEGYLPR